MANLDSVRPGVRAALRRTHTQVKGVALTRALIALAVSGALLSSMTPAVAQPQNPDDAAIAQAEEMFRRAMGKSPAWQDLCPALTRKLTASSWKWVLCVKK